MFIKKYNHLFYQIIPASFCCHLKINIILLQTTYRNMDLSRLSLSVGILSRLYQYFPKNRAILVNKLGAEQKLS